MTGKVTVFKPDEPLPPSKVHDGWGKSRRKLTTAGDVLTESARLYRKCASGEMFPEDMTKGIWALERMAKLAEMSVLERKIEELERKLAEVINGRP